MFLLIRSVAQQLCPGPWTEVTDLDVEVLIFYVQYIKEINQLYIELDMSNCIRDCHSNTMESIVVFSW